MTKSEIMNAIRAKVGSSRYGIWRVGITSDAAKRKTEWSDEGESVDHWSHWYADSAADARDIEAHFIDKGMKGGSGGNLSNATRYVYVF